MISQNEPCPCESGKKYKRCCGMENKKDKKAKQENFFSLYNTPDLLRTIAGLSIMPSNHGKYVRLEKLTVEALRFYNENKKKVSRDELDRHLRTHYPADPLEDPPINLFTEVIAFYGGDYLIFPGITESPGFILNQLLPAIYNWPKAQLPKEFKSNCNHVVLFLLSLSDIVAKKINYRRYLYGEMTETEITIPDAAALEKLKEAVLVTTEEMEDMLQTQGIAPEVLPKFLIHPRDIPAANADPDDNPLLKKPLWKVKEGYIVTNPSTIAYALIDFIKEEAKVFGCSDALHDAYHGIVWNNAKMQLQIMGFKTVEIPDIKEPEDKYIQTLIRQFDDDKIAIIQYLPLSQQGKIKAIDALPGQRETLFRRIAAIPGYAGFQFLDITLISPMGNDTMFAIMGNKISQTISIPVYDLDILSKSRECKALDLWKFALARQQQLPRVAKMMGLSFLDEYKIYKDHSDSFYLSDEAGFDISKWRFGHSQSFIEKVKLLNDEHSVMLTVGQRMAKTMVQRKDKYAPVYFSPMDLADSELQFAVEGFDSAVWVKPVLPGEISSWFRKLYWELTDAVSYWVWQITADIKDKLGSLKIPVINITYELREAQKFEDLDDAFIRDPVVHNKLFVSASPDTAHMVIPDEIMPYFYGADNEGDRLMVRQLLLAFSELLELHKLPGFSPEEMEAIIERNAPVGPKKKFFILHTRSNLLLDQRNIKGYRYIQDYDVSVVLNSIGPLLGDLRPPVGEITESKDKIKLSRNIVMKALLPHLKKIIAQYDNHELIQRLVSLNESLIRHREDLTLKTPTRIACFVSVEQHTEDMLEMFADITRTTIALRCLLEHLAAESASGNKKVSKAGIDELVAIMDQIISWGSLGDQLGFNLFDIRVGVLDSGRIGTQKTVSREIFDPYYGAKAKESVADAIRFFQSGFEAPGTEDENDVPASLDRAFTEEFGISFTGMARFIDILAVLAFDQDTAYAVMHKKDLFEQVRTKDKAISNEEFDHAINFLGLVNRGDVTKIPPGHEGFDISPWRFNRRLSLMRKPLIICDTDDPANPLIYWGPRQLLVSRATIAEQCLTDRLKVSEDSPVKKVTGKFAKKRGAGLVKSVLAALKLPDTILDDEVTIALKGRLKHTKDIGDVDVLLIDLARKIVFSLECKSFAASRNIKEMIEEYEKLMGSSSDKGLIKKHEERHEWLTANLDQLGHLYKTDLSGFKIVSAFVTRENMLFPFLKKNNVSMPFVTKYDLEEKGYDALLQLVR